MRISIVIPIYNELHEIGNVVESILKKGGFDVVVVDDGSTDSSGDVAKEKGAIVIRNDSRHGKGYSLKKGFEYTLQEDYDAIIVMDGDGQHDIGDIDQFLVKTKEDPVSVITGNRMASTKHMPWVRRLTNRLLSSLVSHICRQKIPDSQCGYRYIHRDILKQLHLESNNFQIETEVLIKASRLGYHVHSVPIKTIYNDEESKINPVKDTFRFIVYLFREMRVK